MRARGGDPHPLDPSSTALMLARHIFLTVYPYHNSPDHQPLSSVSPLNLHVPHPSLSQLYMHPSPSAPPHLSIPLVSLSASFDAAVAAALDACVPLRPPSSVPFHLSAMNFPCFLYLTVFDSAHRDVLHQIVQCSVLIFCRALEKHLPDSLPI